MRGRFVVFISLLLTVCLCFGCRKSKPAASSPESFESMNPIVIKYAHAIPEGELMNYMIEDWMKSVTQKSAGKITFDYYPHGSLGTFVEIIEQVDLGAVDMSSGEPSLYEPLCPEISMLYAPLICDGYDHLGKCIYGKPGALIAKAMSEKNNTYILDWVYSGARVIASTKPLRTLQDMKGLVIRSPESQVYIDTFTLLGMSQTQMSMTEMYNALQVGVVEACECPEQALYAGKYHTITGNICKTRHMYTLGTLSVNEKFWDNLPKAAKELMLNVWNELKYDFNAQVQASEDGFYEKFKTEGTTVTEFEDRVEFRKVAEPYWIEKAVSIGGNAGEILSAINELR